MKSIWDTNKNTLSRQRLIVISEVAYILNLKKDEKKISLYIKHSNFLRILPKNKMNSDLLLETSWPKLAKKLHELSCKISSFIKDLSDRIIQIEDKELTQLETN